MSPEPQGAHWSSWLPPEQDAFFERSERLIADQERQLRQLAEQQLRTYVRLVQDFASIFLAGELDAAKRADPDFVNRVTPADWRRMLERVQHGGSAAGWQPPDASATARWQAEAERLAGEVRRLESEVRRLANLLQASAETAERDEPGGGPREAPVLAPADGAVALPPMPAVVPVRFDALGIKNWPRVALALSALAVTGWSMRQALVELVASRLGGIKPTAGSLRPLLETMTKAGLWIEGKVVLGGLHRQEADAASDTTLILVCLSQTGKELLRACGVPAVESEWERLIRLQDGARRSVHSGLVCAFAYHARLRGYATTVCPETALPVAPDIGLTQAGAQLLVVVEDGGEPPERRAARWREQVELQGQVAICAISTEQRVNLVAEARVAGVEHGVATDLQTLLDTQGAASPLWADQW